MIKISRFDLADFVSPERIADEIIHKISDLPIPVPIEELAKMLDIISVEALTIEGFEGGLVTDAEKSEGFVLVNRASSPQRQRFTIGHELCHFLSPFHKPPRGDEFLCSSVDMGLTFARKQDNAACMEVEANRFAASLLMPLAHFRKDLRLQKGADINHILTLARRYETSKEATARRYVDVHDEPCAIIVSRNGRILRFYRGEDFPYLDVEGRNPVPHGSLTSQTDLTQGAVSDSEERKGGTWLSTQQGRRVPMIYEQVLPQTDGYRLTLLTLAEDLEEIEEEENLEESWTPRFRS
jgi:Zn-dependent peptidase ImmA (M78 family)